MRTDSRVADLNVIVCGSSRAHTEVAFRRLVQVMLPREGQPLPKLVAEYPTGEILELPFVYNSGLEVDRASSLPLAADFLVSIECPGPFWTARDALQFAVANAAIIDGLLPHLAELNVMSSTAADSITVENPGDVEANLAWTLTGPGGPVVVSVNGVGFEFKTPLVLGEVVTIERTALGVEVLDQSGTNRYAALGRAPKFPRLPPGSSLVNVTMANASAGTLVATTDVVATNRVTSPALRTNGTGWSTYATDAVEVRVSNGFDGSAAGYLQLSWASESVADAAVQVEVAVTPGEQLSGGLSILSSTAQVFYPTCVFVGADGEPVGPLFVGDAVEVPADTPVQLVLTEQDIGVAPEGAAALRIMASVDSVTGQPWPAGAYLRASRAIVSDAPLEYFDGASEFAGWAGTANDSQSLLYRTIIVGQSSVTGYYKPRWEAVY
ncbi:hypothetical protein [Cryobacterium sp. AP23]